MSIANPPPQRPTAATSPTGQPPASTVRRLPRWLVYGSLGVFAGAAIMLGWMAMDYRRGRTTGRPAWFGGGGVASDDDSLIVIPPPYDEDRAMGYLRKLCDFGPRKTGSRAMVAQQDYLREFFNDRGGEVIDQAFEIRDPQTGQPVRVVNLIARFAPAAAQRYLLAAHYDTRPFPDNDPRNKRGRFVGANDGASGTAALMEWSHRFGDLPPNIGVDVVLFDAEELVYDAARDEYFIGSTYFATQHRNDPSTTYVGGVLLDMVGDRELKLFYERNSLRYAPEITRGIWKTARRLGIRQFVPRVRHEIRDDHLPLNQIAGIPTVDIIDFDYPRPGAPTYWHTTLDVPAKCSGRSLATVVYVLDRWLREQSESTSPVE